MVRPAVSMVSTKIKKTSRSKKHTRLSCQKASCIKHADNKVHGLHPRLSYEGTVRFRIVVRGNVPSCCVEMFWRICPSLCSMNPMPP